MPIACPQCAHSVPTARLQHSALFRSNRRCCPQCTHSMPIVFPQHSFVSLAVRENGLPPLGVGMALGSRLIS